MNAIKEGLKKISKAATSGFKSVTAKVNQFQVPEKVKIVSQNVTSQAASKMKNVVNRGSETSAQGSQTGTGKVRQMLGKIRIGNSSKYKSKPTALSKFLSSSTTLTRKVITNSIPHMNTIWNCVKVELRPPTYSEILDAKELATQAYLKIYTRQYLQNTVGQVLQTTLVAIEVTMWFFVGEILGRKNVIGYKV